MIRTDVGHSVGHAFDIDHEAYIYRRQRLSVRQTLRPHNHKIGRLMRFYALVHKADRVAYTHSAALLS